MLNTILYLHKIDCVFISIISGMSLLTLVFLIITSFVFSFCLYHRIFLYYATTIDIINWIDVLYTIPIAATNLLRLEIILAGITIIMAIISYVRHHKKSFTSNSWWYWHRK